MLSNIIDSLLFRKIFYSHFFALEAKNMVVRRNNIFQIKGFILLLLKNEGKNTIIQNNIL